MRASQEIGKLEIRVVGVTKMRQNYFVKWWDGVVYGTYSSNLGSHWTE